MGEWEERSATREREMEAMDQASKILAEVTNVRTEPPTNPVPPPSPLTSEPTLLQIVDPKMKAVQVLLAAAHKAHLHNLDRLAQEISAHLAGPFDDVNNMMEKMIFHLM